MPHLAKYKISVIATGKIIQNVMKSISGFFCKTTRIFKNVYLQKHKNFYQIFYPSVINMMFYNFIDLFKI